MINEQTIRHRENELESNWKLIKWNHHTNINPRYSSTIWRNKSCTKSFSHCFIGIFQTGDVIRINWHDREKAFELLSLSQNYYSSISIEIHMHKTKDNKTERNYLTAPQVWLDKDVLWVRLKKVIVSHTIKSPIEHQN